MEKDMTGFEEQDSPLAQVLKELIAEVIPQNCVVVFKAPKESVAEVAKFCASARETFARYKIFAIPCPSDIEIITLPAGTPPERIELKKKETPIG